MTLLLLTPDVGFEQRVRAALGNEVSVVRADDHNLFEDPRAAVPEMLQAASGAQVVMVGPGIDRQRALAYAYEFDLQRPDVSVILCAPANAELLSDALRAGVRDVLDPLAGDHRILDSYKNATEAALRTKRQYAGDERQSEDHGRLIAVVSPKGGSGKTTLATNLAVGLASAAPGRVAIVDLDLQFGDVASALSLMPEHSISDAARMLSSLDSMALKILLTHHPTDVYALCAPESPADGERVAAAQTAEILRLLVKEFRYVVVDTAVGLGEQTLAATELASDLVLVCSMDVPGVRSFRKALIALDQIGMTNATRHVVLTRADARVGLNTDDIERTIGRRIDVSIPSTRMIPLSLNQGIPILQSDQRRAAVYEALRKLVERFAEVPLHPGGDFRLWRWRS